VTYRQGAHLLSRWLEDPADAVIADAVHAAAELDDQSRADLRAALAESDCYNLLTFANRRAAASLRDASLSEAVEAVEALTLVTRDKVDYRDLSVAFPLYAVGKLGGDPIEVLMRAAERSEPGTQRVFTAKSDRASKLTLRECGLIEVRSSHGLGFMQTSADPYNPRSDLIWAAVQLADFIDEEGRYRVNSLALSPLPSVWFDHPGKGGIQIPTAGCLSLSAGLVGARRWSHQLLVFLAEVGNQAIAATLATRASDASTADRPRVAGATGRLLLVVIGGSVTQGEVAIETPTSLGLLLAGMLGTMRFVE
jgi:hypothetical protein